MKKILLVMSVLSFSLQGETNDYLSCADRLAKEFASSLELGVSSTERIDYGFSKIIESKFQKHSNSDRYFYEYTTKGNSAQLFTYASKNEGTKLKFNLDVRYYQSKFSKFGSGKQTTRFECCVESGTVVVKDLFSGMFKDFDLPSGTHSYFETSSCSNKISKIKQFTLSGEPIEYEEGYSEFKEFTPNLCSKMGKKKKVWNQTRRFDTSSTFNYACSGRDRWRNTASCTRTDTSEYIAKTRHTGCRLTFKFSNEHDPMVSDSSIFVKKNNYYHKADKLHANGKLVVGADRTRAIALYEQRAKVRKKRLAAAKAKKDRRRARNSRRNSGDSGSGSVWNPFGID